MKKSKKTLSDLSLKSIELNLLKIKGGENQTCNCNPPQTSCAPIVDSPCIEIKFETCTQGIVCLLPK